MRRLTVTVLIAILAGVAGSQVVTAQSPSPGLVGLGGRVDLPEQGFAVTFPDDWAWVSYTTEDFDSVMAQLADITSPEFVAENEAWFDALDSETPLAGQATDSDSGCVVFVVSMDAPVPLDIIALAYIEEFKGEPDMFPDGATLTDVALPAAQSKRVDASQLEKGWTSPLETSHYLLVRGSRFYDIICTASDLPADGWLSIAETFEFLPAEGS